MKARTINSTIQTKFNEIKNRLSRAGIDRPDIAAGMVAASAINCPRLELFSRLDDQLASAQVEDIAGKVRRLEEYEPIQYVLGRTDFMGFAFKCDRRALIPRPETEELVEMVCGYEPLWRIESPSIIDIGTGSGCIIISLALAGKKGRFWAVDVSSSAIELARENAIANQCQSIIKFISTDLSGERIPDGMDAVVANPPYVRTADFPGLEKHIRLWEPRLALDGGEDGLQVIRPLISKAFQILKPSRFFFMEIGFDQWGKVQQLLAETGFKSGFVRRDQSGHNRMVMAIK